MQKMELPLLQDKENQMGVLTKSNKGLLVGIW